MNLPVAADIGEGGNEYIPSLFDMLPIEVFNKITGSLDKRSVNILRLAYRDFSRLTSSYPIDMHSARMVLQTDPIRRKCDNGSQMEFKLTDDARDVNMAIESFGARYPDANFDEFVMTLTLTTRRIQQLLKSKIRFSANTVRIKHCYESEELPDTSDNEGEVDGGRNLIRQAHVIRHNVRIRANTANASNQNAHCQFNAPWRPIRRLIVPQAADRVPIERGRPEQFQPPPLPEMVHAAERVGIIEEGPAEEIEAEPVQLDEIPPQLVFPAQEMPPEDEGVIMVENPGRLHFDEDDAAMVQELLNNHEIVNDDDDDPLQDDRINWMPDIDMLDLHWPRRREDEQAPLNNNEGAFRREVIPPNNRFVFPRFVDENDGELAILRLMEDDVHHAHAAGHARRMMIRRRWLDGGGNQVDEQPDGGLERDFFQQRALDANPNPGVVRRVAVNRRRRLREIEIERRRLFMWRDFAAAGEGAELNLFPHEDVRRLERRLQAMVYHRPIETAVEPMSTVWKRESFTDYVMRYRPIKLALEYVDTDLFNHFWDTFFEKISEIHMLEWNRPCEDLFKCTQMTVHINHFNCANPEKFLQTVIKECIRQNEFGHWTLGINHSLAMGPVLDDPAYKSDVVVNGAGEYRIRMNLFVLILSVRVDTKSQANIVTLIGNRTHELHDGRMVSNEGCIINLQMDDEYYTDDDFLYSDSNIYDDSDNEYDDEQAP